MAHILAVDDSEPIRKLVQLVLTSAGHTVDLACDGQEGIEAFSGKKYDIIVTDINMPRMNGIEFIKAVRGRDEDIPILALTTESEEPMRQQGQAAGANGWIVKPFKAPQFLDIIRQISE